MLLESNHKHSSATATSQLQAKEYQKSRTCVLTTSGLMSKDAKQNEEKVSVKLYSGTGHKENIGTGLRK